MSRPARGGWIEIHLNGALTDIAGPVGAAIPWDNKIENKLIIQIMKRLISTVVHG